MTVTRLPSSQEPEALHSHDPLAGLPECVLVATEQLICELLEAAEEEVDLDDWHVVAAELDVTVAGARSGWLVTVGHQPTQTILGTTTVFEPVGPEAVAA